MQAHRWRETKRARCCDCAAGGPSKLDQDDWSFASLQQIEHCSRRLAQIDDATTDVRTAVVDAYDHLPAILDIAHAHAGAKRKRPVRRSQIVHVETLTARRALAVKARPVPGGLAAA